MPNADVDAYVFDAYGTLYDVQSVGALAERLAPGHGAALVNLWRAKQLEYTWLTSLMEHRHDFAQVTAEALGYAAAALRLALGEAAQRELAAAWLDLSPYPDAIDTLKRLAPARRWILSNGTLAMLEPLVARSGLRRHLDGILSVDAAGIYKPSPRVYALATAQLKLAPGRVGFVSANGWDAIGAKSFGFRVWWINRARLPVDRHGPSPDTIIGELSEI